MVVWIDYHKYIRSEEWSKKKCFLRKKRKNRCEICYSRKNLHVHHKTYRRLGREKLTDLIFLCSFCHKKVHEFAKKTGMNIWNATGKYKKISQKNKNREKYPWNGYSITQMRKMGIKIPMSEYCERTNY